MVRLVRIFLVCVFAAVAAPSLAHAGQPVAVKLALAVDTSVSVSMAEYRLQMHGIAQALRHLRIITAIEDRPGGVAVTLVHRSLGSLNRQAVGWRHLEEAADTFDFANEVERLIRLGAGRGTSISDAIMFAARLIAQNNFSGQSLKIYIAGDSRHNSGLSSHAARDLALHAGVTINGLVIEDGDRNLA